MTQGKKEKSKTEVLKKQSKDILDLEKTIQKGIQVNDLSLIDAVDESVDSICANLFTKEKKSQSKPEVPASGDAFVLTLSNHLKIAENKIKELEQNNENLRLDNEKLMVAGDALKEALDKFSNENKVLKSTYKEERMSWADQKNELENSLEDQSTEIKSLKMKIGSLEKHLSRDVKKIRMRERELENRLILKQSEMEGVTREKDHTLLKFKQELDILREKAESDRKNHHLWMEKRIQDKERIGRAIQALQLSLQLLESSFGQAEEFVLEEKSELFEKTSSLLEPKEVSLSQVGSSAPAAVEDNPEDSEVERGLSKEEDKIEKEAG